MKVYLNEKRITQAEAKELVGEKRFNQMVKEYKEEKRIDPLADFSWYVGLKQTLTLI